MQLLSMKQVPVHDQLSVRTWHTGQQARDWPVSRAGAVVLLEPEL